MVMSGGQGDDACHGYIAVSWRRDMRKSVRMKKFSFLFILIESSTFVIF